MRARPWSPPLPAYLNALTGEGVHVVTVNDYLAERDSEWMGRVYRFLGLDVGVHPGRHDARPSGAAAYAADITYGTNNEFGFDYLRDNMAWSTETSWSSAATTSPIVDEVDSILIDEARTPLIISGPADAAAEVVHRVRQAGHRGCARDDATTRSTRRSARSASSSPASTGSRTSSASRTSTRRVNTPLVGFLNNAIKAKELFKRDKDYVVMNGEVLIVDEHTGRMLAGRRYNEGMHQAIEAKEGVRDQGREPDPGHDHAAELLPAVRQALRHDRHGHDRGRRVQADLQARRRADPDQPADDRASTSRTWSTSTEEAKFNAVVEDIVERHANGPAGAGRHRRAWRRARTCPSLLRKRGCRTRCSTPSTTSGRRRSSPRPGRKGAVTVATNMAGRGTDIMLGGNAEFMAAPSWPQRGLSPVETPEEYEAAWPEALERRPRRPSPPSTTRSSSSAGCTCWAPSGTSRAASTTSCAAAPAARATRASPGSTCRSRTT